MPLAHMEGAGELLPCEWVIYAPIFRGMQTRAHILVQIEAFLRQAGISEREFGLRAVNDHKFVPRLRAGRATLGRIERAEAFMRDWPSAATVVHPDQEAA